MATELERLVVSIQANTSDIDNKLRLLNASVNNAMGAIENRTAKMTGVLSSHFLNLGRLTRTFTAGFAVMQTIRFGENIAQNFDKITESARKFGIEVDQSLIAKMQTADVAVSKAWTNMQLAAAPAIASMSQGVANLINNLSGAPASIDALTNSLRVAREQAERNAGTGAGRAAQARVDAIQQQRIGALPFLAPESAASGIGPVDAALMDRIQKEKLQQQGAVQDFALRKAIEQKVLDDMRTVGVGDADIKEKIIAERKAVNDAILENDRKLAEEQLEIDNENFKAREDAREKIKQELNRPAEDQAKINDELVRRSIEQMDRLKERVIGDFAQTAAAVVTHAKNIGDAFRGLMKSIASALIENVIKDALAKVTAKGIGSILSGAFAGGGDVYPGGRFLVGERGPEIFAPSVPGHIYPSGTGPGGAISISVDARGAQQGVAEQLRAMLPGVIAQAVKASDSRFARNYDMTIRDKR